MRYWTKQLHPSWLIAWTGAGALLGIALSASQQAYFSLALMSVLAGVLLSLAFSKRTVGAVVLAVTAGILLGLWRGDVEIVGVHRYQRYIGKKVAVTGTVQEDTSYGPSGDQRVILKSVSINGERLNGQVWVSTDSFHTIKRSDTLTLTGKLGKGFGSLAAGMFHAQVVRITRPQPGDIGLAVRDWFAGGIHRAIPDPEASLASGYLVGQRSALPADLDTQLKTVGLTHAVVASGYNLTILVGLARQALLGVSKYLATLSAIIMIIGFVGLSGLSPSMTRAALVTGLGLAAWYFGRRFHPLVLLAVAAAVTALFNPFYVWGDIGWYLSFASFAGVIILGPLIEHSLWHGRDKPGVIAKLIIETMAAQVSTLPIMIFAFGQYSPYALLANLLVLPLIPLTMLLTFVAGSVGLAFPAVAHIAGVPATLALRYMTTIVARVADLPGAQGNVSMNAPMMLVCYAALVAVIVTIWVRTKYNPRYQEEAAPEISP